MKKDVDKSKPGVNRRLLRRIQKHILEEPKRVYMGKWRLRKEDSIHRQVARSYALKFPSCGTIGCIAGWAITLRRVPENDDPGFQGQELLGLSDTEAARLFYVADWPQEFEDRLRDCASGTKQYAQVVSDRIDYFLEHRK